MTSKVLNLLWINLDFPAINKFGNNEFLEPLPQKYRANIRTTSQINSDTEVRLWLDSKRLTKEQWHYLETELSDHLSKNLRLMDLRNIPEYDQNPLFSEAEYSPNWRDRDKNSLIWRQVDTAKILICLQDDFDQVFYSDMDFISTLKTDAKDVQTMLGKHGIMLRGWVHDGKASFENQLWGFDKTRRPFFELLHMRTLNSCLNFYQNGYGVLVSMVRQTLEEREGMDTREICYAGRHDGSSAHHPGHVWSHGKSNVINEPSTLLNEFNYYDDSHSSNLLETWVEMQKLFPKEQPKWSLKF